MALLRNEQRLGKFAKIPIFLVSIFLILCVGILGACGNSAIPASPEESMEWSIRTESDTPWALADTVCLPADIDSRYLFFSSDALLYLSRESSGYFLHVRKFSEGNTSESALQSSETVTALMNPFSGSFEDIYLCGVCPDVSAKEEFWCLYRIKNPDGTKDDELVRYTHSGSPLITISVDGPEETEVSQFRISAAAKDGFCYFLRGDKLTILTEEGRRVLSRETPYGSQILELQRQYYLAQPENQNTSLNRLEEGAVSEKVWEIPLAGNLFYTNDGDRLYLSSGNRLYQCSLQTQTAECVLEWDAVDLKFAEIRSLAAIADDSVRVCGFGNTGETLWTAVPAEEADTRIPVTMLANQYEYETAAWVQGFNQSNPAYRVVLADPGFSGDIEWEDLETKVRLLLTSADAPDLLDVSLFSDRWRSWASNDVFVDLAPFLESGSTIRESDYLPNIWACGSVDGKQIYIPFRFNFSMLFGQEGCVGGETGWTLDELLTVCERHPDTPALPYGASSCLRELLLAGMDEFVDYSEGTCNFENPLFYRALECSARADSWQYDPQFQSNRWTPMDEVLNGRVLMDSCIINCSDDFLAYQADVPAGREEPISLSLKGYPSKNSQPAGMGYLPAGRGAFAICRSGKNKEGAWAFIEYVIEQSPDLPIILSMPAKTERLKEFLSRSSGVTNQNYKQLGLKQREPDAEDVEKLMEIIQNLKFISAEDSKILEIIAEETQPYFRGDKSKEAVSEIIQRRVSLYLAESAQ